MSVLANNTQIAYQEAGPKDGPVVLLIMGLGAQLTMWPPRLIDGLTNLGYRVITFDNRDIGLSQKFPDIRAPNLLGQAVLKRLGLSHGAPYTLHEMTDDAVGLLQALKVERAHVVGVSMGGMIAQLLAAKYPNLISSLTAISSTTNNPGLPSSDWRVLLAMARRGTPPATVNGAINQTLYMLKAIGTPGEDPWVNGLRERVERSYARSYYPVGSTRQMAAIVASGDLRRWSRRITAPSLVLHGTHDRLVPLSGGKDIARTIAGSQLEIINGMGHDLPDRFLLRIISRLTFHFEQAQGLCLEATG